MYIPDNYDMWASHEAEQEKKLCRMPKCTECGERIQQDRAVYVYGGYICDYCLKDLRQEILID